MSARMDVDSDTKQSDSVDEALYNRQLYVIDHESMKKMQQSTVLLAGMNGLGAEIAKNTILAGVKSVTVYDQQTVQINDLASNFYLKPESVGKQTRSAACIEDLKSLNPYVDVSVVDDSGISLQQLIESKKYDVVVLVNYTLDEVVRYNTIAHALNLRFISCDALGVFGQIFVDFGTEFECTDLTGEPAVQGMIVNISKDKHGIVQVHEDTRHGLSDGDFVRFEEIEGMTELNELSQPIAIKVTSPYAFDIGDTTAFGDYTGNGLYFQVKRDQKLSFLPLSELLSMKDAVLMNAKQPKILQSDFSKNPSEQHLFYRALQEYRVAHENTFPPSTDVQGEECGKVFAIFKRLCAEYGLKCQEEEEVKSRVIALARASSAVINPMCAFLGGMVAQEVLKACSHKFTPLQQLFYFDAMECLPDHSKMNSAEFAPINSRYDDYIKVFGAELQRRVWQSRMFLVGAGAIGCEMLKNWAMMGVACDPQKQQQQQPQQGHITVTDMDQIETSNLNRQFLFRQKDVGSAKAVSAAKAAQVMNADLAITAHENRVGSDSEHVYNYSFWNGLTAVCTALDNVSARLYVDAQCVFYRKPLLESGTLGTKGNTQIVVPNLTESYGSTRDPEEKGVPICTLKNFPNKIEHTIQWARDDFEGEFTHIVKDINRFLEEGDTYLAELHSNNPSEEVTTLQNIKKHLGDARPLSFEQCVHWARNKFEFDFSNRIKQLLYNFPHDAVTTEGAKFWSPPKRAPDAIAFDDNDALHMAYIVAASNLRASVFGLKGSTEFAEIRQHLKSCTVPPFRIDENAEIETGEKDEEKEKTEAMDADIDFDAELQQLLQALPDRKKLIGMKLNAAEFEKDDETNFHMDFVQASANLRARNYRIAEKSKHEIKKIAGKIIPAIATTTALVTGLICLEFYKLLQSQNKTIEHYRSSYVNLALPLVTMSDPVPAPQTTVYKKGEEWNYTLWDVIEIKNGANMTMKDLIQYFDTEWQCDLSMMSYGNAMVYAFYMNAMKLMKRKKMKLVDLVQEVCGKLDDGVKALRFEVNVDYQTPPQNGDEEPMLPTVVVYL